MALVPKGPDPQGLYLPDASSSAQQPPPGALTTAHPGIYLEGSSFIGFMEVKGVKGLMGTSSKGFT